MKYSLIQLNKNNLGEWSLKSLSFFLTSPDRSQKLPVSNLTIYERAHFWDFWLYTGHEFEHTQDIYKTVAILDELVKTRTPTTQKEKGKIINWFSAILWRFIIFSPTVLQVWASKKERDFNCIVMREGKCLGSGIEQYFTIYSLSHHKTDILKNIYWREYYLVFPREYGEHMLSNHLSPYVYTPTSQSAYYQFSLCKYLFNARKYHVCQPSGIVFNAPSSRGATMRTCTLAVLGTSAISTNNSH